MQDPGEPGIQNISVTLTGDVDGDGEIDTLTVETDEFGHYDFTGLYPGDYTVEVDVNDPNLPSGSAVTTPVIFNVTLSPGEDYNDADFGFQVPPIKSALGDFVWNDLNNNGMQDPGEPGIANVTIELWEDINNDGTYDTLIATTITDAVGNYLFEGLPGSDYQVRVTDDHNVLDGYTLTTANEPYDYSLASDEVHLDADFGYWREPPLSSFGDRVWLDLNGNGIQDPGEQGIGGVTIELRDKFGTPIATAITDEYGYYNFTGLAAGDYTAVVTDTAGVLDDYEATTPTANAHLLGADEYYRDADFGYVPKPSSLGSIGDTVWYDLDGDGVVGPGEAGIPGVTIVLKDCSGNPVSVTSTDALGHYHFPNLSSGCYAVYADESTLPPGLHITTHHNPMTVNLGDGEDFVLADFGYRATASTPTPTPTAPYPPMPTPTPTAPYPPTPTPTPCFCEGVTLLVSDEFVSPGTVVTVDCCIPQIPMVPVDLYCLIRSPVGVIWSIQLGGSLRKGIYPCVEGYSNESCVCGPLFAHTVCEDAPEGDYLAAIIIMPEGVPPNARDVLDFDWKAIRKIQ